MDADLSREYIEKMRWPDGPICPHCGLIGEAYKIETKATPLERLKETRQRVRKPRKGLWKCKDCKKQFTVTVGTIFEDSHIPLNKWLLAIHLMCSSKKGISAHQLMRNLDIKQYKSAWFMAHRIRFALTGELLEPLTGIVECDETFIGGKRRNRHHHAIKPGEREKDRMSPVEDKAAVFAVLQRDGSVVSRHVDKVTAKNLMAVINEVVSPDAHVMTDEGPLKGIGKTHKHGMVNHSENEYVRKEDGIKITTNGVEGYFAILKRGVMGTFHHISKKHLHRYLGEFDFRYSGRMVTDGERAKNALGRVEGKRLMYKDPIKQKS
jgi:transposase-like protein